MTSRRARGAGATVGAMAAALIVAEPEGATRGFLERQLVQDGFQVAAGGRRRRGARPGRAPASGSRPPRRARALPPAPGGRARPLVGPRRARHPARPGGGRLARRSRPRARARAPTTTSTGRSPTRSCGRGSRRCSGGPARARPRSLEAGEITIDRPTRCVSVAGQRLHLAAKEYELLTRLAEEPRRVFTKDELLSEIWGFMSKGRTRTLDSHASRLRNKLRRSDRRRRT